MRRTIIATGLPRKSGRISRCSIGASAWYFESRGYLQARANDGQSPASVNTVTYSLGAADGAQNVVAGLRTKSAAYRVSDHWIGRISWHRVVTGYDRDSDIFLAGVGYKF
ncbi:hypothetical protein [Pandoraea communis]|uniref:Uncharacterized protein n=1 Tax=Pandoraea communis TaxID=2508297 RepID=A0A5E4VJG2_9BURK|nr:hypothetical protein [Pandoraea communis]MDM8357542.1 hypothetical protein [Pandoraea communis]VVE12351.1 hypothetical protein PCO31111_02727 [Pandoraea communis]